MNTQMLMSLFNLNFGQLGAQDGSNFTFSILYALVGFVVALAIMNGFIGILAGNDKIRNVNKSIWQKLFYTILLAQITIGLAPLVIIGRGIYKGYEISVFTYGMPIFQIITILFCLYYQIKLINRVKKYEDTFSESHGLA